DYILRCTHRIWEGKDVGLIETHYAPDIVFHTMTGPAQGAAAVIANTARTLAAFPDRALIGEAVIWSDEGAGAYLSSHRITSTATNRGASEFGPATGRRIAFTTVADCLCRANRITEEWLVRDNSGMALALGADPVLIARAQAAADRAQDAAPAAWRQAAMAAVHARPATGFPARALPDADAEPHAFVHAVFDGVLAHRRFGMVRDAWSPAAHWQGPGARRLFGHGEITGWFTALIASFGDARISVDHVAAQPLPGGSEIAVRWSLAGSHDGHGLYGPPTGRPVWILGVSHWRIAAGVIIRDVTIFDEIALLRQIEGGL
ncbi:MAG: ester cyclase, partial [Sandarakinorhabdus sp.]|nr:ester cyclase [Sandarakinorhabdus sp.]